MAETIDPASLRKRLAFYNVTAGSDAFGDAAGGAPVLAFALFGSLVPLSTGERMSYLAAQHEITHRITVRWRSTISAGMVIQYAGREFHIVGMKNVDERNEYLEITALESIPTKTQQLGT